jgi:hypothetical protein
MLCFLLAFWQLDECVRHLDRDIEQRFQSQWFAINGLLKALPFQQLHRNEGLAVVLPDLVDGANVGMV